MGITERIGGMPLTMKCREWSKKNISWQQIDMYYTSLLGQSAFFNLELFKHGNASKLFVRDSYLSNKSPCKNLVERYNL